MVCPVTQSNCKWMETHGLSYHSIKLFDSPTERIITLRVTSERITSERINTERITSERITSERINLNV